MRCILQFSIMAVAALALSSTNLLGQSSPLADYDTAIEEGLRLKAISLAREAAKSDPMVASIFPQLLPMVSDYTEIHPYSAENSNPVKHAAHQKRVEEAVAAEQLQFPSAIPRLVELARDRRVVILNEAHDMPQHRAFGLQLARALREAGFDYLAMETLSRPDHKSGLCTFDYPTMSSGYYSKEPVFGDFLREANRLGFKLVAYEIEMGQNTSPENQYDSIIERENAQSDNLIRHVLDNDPTSRVFVYVGYSHAREDWKTVEGDRELGWMAAQLARKTGLDPLTIDQVGGSYNPKSESVDPIFSVMEQSGKLDQSRIAEFPDGVSVVSDGYFGSVDVTVFHPVQHWRDGRPTWLHMDGYRRPARIPNSEYFAGGPTLLQAFVADEGPEAIPVDQVLIESAEGHSTLLAPPGHYRLITESPEGQLTETGTLHIEGE